MAEGGKGFDLGRMVGPLPLGGWLAVVGGGIGIAYFVNRNKKAGAEGETPSGSATPTMPAVAIPAGGIVLRDFSTGATTPVSSDSQPSTNQEWLSVASRWLIARGYEPTMVTRALGKYLQGDELTAQERATVDEALAKFGPPPLSVPITPGPGPPSPPDSNNRTFGGKNCTAYQPGRNSGSWPPAPGRATIRLFPPPAGLFRPDQVVNGLAWVIAHEPGKTSAQAFHEAQNVPVEIAVGVTVPAAAVAGWVASATAACGW